MSSLTVQRPGPYGGFPAVPQVKSTQVQDPFGLRETYRNNPDIIDILDKIDEALANFNPKENRYLDLHETDFRPLSNLKVANGELLNLETLLMILSQKSQYPFDRANLSKANLSEATLIKADLYRINLSKATLIKTNFYGANLDEANLEEVHSEGADFSGASLNRARLYGAHLEGAHLNGTHLSEVNLSGAHLNGAYLYGTHLGATLYGTDLRGADLRRAFASVDFKELTGKALKKHLVKHFHVVINDETKF